MRIRTIIHWVKSLGKSQSYHDEVDRYVTSKNPTTTAEVEYWIRQYDQNQKGWSL